MILIYNQFTITYYNLLLNYTLKLKCAFLYSYRFDHLKMSEICDSSRADDSNISSPESYSDNEDDSDERYTDNMINSSDNSPFDKYKDRNIVLNNG